MKREKGPVVEIFEAARRKLAAQPQMCLLPRHTSGGYVEPTFRNLCTEVDLPGERRISPTGRMVYGFDTASGPDETVFQKIDINDTLIFDQKPISLSEIDYSKIEARAMAWQRQQAKDILNSNFAYPSLASATNATDEAITCDDIFNSIKAIIAKYPKALTWDNEIPSFHLDGLIHLNLCESSLILFHACFQQSVELTPERVELSAPYFDGSEFLEILYRVEAVDRIEYLAIRKLYPRTEHGWMSPSERGKRDIHGWADRSEEDRRAIWRGILWAMHARRHRRAEWLNLMSKVSVRNQSIYASLPCA